VSDVDGVLTNGHIFIHSDGTESKQFCVEDGTGAALARVADLPIALISGRYSKVTSIRAEEMRIEHCIQTGLNKVEPFRKLCETYQLRPDQVAYIGDGLVDIPVMELAGVTFAPPNSHPRVKALAHIITQRSGGKGVLREVVERILQDQDRLDMVLQKMRDQIYLAPTKG